MEHDPTAGSDDAQVPPPPVADLAAFHARLSQGGLREALRFLNARTPHRFTGVFRFDGDMLRSVALVDKWLKGVDRGEDVPLASAYCAHLQRTGQALAVADGSRDPRVPWMAGGPMASYCGAPIRDDTGEPWGALCHFDELPCESKDSDMPLIAAAAAVIHEAAAGADSGIE